MSRVPQIRNRPPPIQSIRCPWLALSAAALFLAAVTTLFPWYASAWQVERAGRILDSDPYSEEARASLLRAVDRNPRNAQAYRLLAQLDARRGDWPGAAGAWAHFVAQRPSDPQGTWSLAVACEQIAPADLGRLSGLPCGTDEANRQQVLVRLWQSAGQTATGFVRAGNSLRPASTQEAIAYYRRALLLDPDSSAAWSELADTYRASAEEEAALDAYAQVISLNSDPEAQASAHAARGEMLAARGQWDQASRELAAAAELVPENGDYHLKVGSYLRQAGGDPQIARSHLLEAARLLPANPWPHVHLAALAFSDEEYETALEEAHTAAALDHGLVWAWLWRGKALAAVGRLPEAEDSLRRAAYLAPDMAEPHAELGLLLQQALRLDEAILELEEAVQLSPEKTAYRLMLARAYRADGQNGAAAAAYRRVLELDPANAAAKQALDEMGY